MGAEPLLSAIVVNWNNRDLLSKCLASLRAHLGSVAHETIVVDNASADGSAEAVEAEFPGARLIRNAENLGFGPGNNIGMAAARGRFLLLINSDARLVDDSILRLLEELRERPRVGVAGPRIRFEDGKVQPSAHRFGSLRLLALEELGLYKLLSPERRAELLLGGYWGHDREREADWVLGACMLVRREVFERTGGFDPAIFLYGEEEEWCYRIRAAGFGILFSPVAEVFHVGHASAHLLLGPSGRVDRCMLAADALLARWEGPVAGALAPVIRVGGALLKLLVFGLRRLVVRDDAYGREVLWTARTVLAHYARRASGRLQDAA